MEHVTAVGMSRTITKLANAGIGFVLGYFLGSRLRSRRSGLAVGLVAALALAVAGGRSYDRVEQAEGTEDRAETETVESPSA